MCTSAPGGGGGGCRRARAGPGCRGPPPGAPEPPHLCLLVNVFAHALTQHNEHGHGHLHVAPLRIEVQHVPHQHPKEVGGQPAVIQRMGHRQQREGVRRGQGGRVRLAAAHVWGLSLVLQLLWPRWRVHNLVAQWEGLLRQHVLGVLGCGEAMPEPQACLTPAPPPAAALPAHGVRVQGPASTAPPPRPQHHPAGSRPARRCPPSPRCLLREGGRMLGWP